MGTLLREGLERLVRHMLKPQTSDVKPLLEHTLQPDLS